MRLSLAIAGWIVTGVAAQALDLQLPANAVQTLTKRSTFEQFTAPITIFENGDISMASVEGVVDRSAWRVSSPGLTPLQVISPLRDALVDAGYTIQLDCGSSICGGYDFRFRLDTLPAPSMFVNIRSYHYITALRGPAETPDEIISLLASTAATAAHIQIIHAGQSDDAPRPAPQPSNQPATTAVEAPEPVETTKDTPSDLSSMLLADGRFILTELEFASGTARLGENTSPQLEALAQLMNARPDLRLALVGHTDSVGGLQGNITLSRRRASAVRDALISSYGVNGQQIQAQGMGFLAPIASNLTDGGREANRRVEVIVLGDG